MLMNKSKANKSLKVNILKNMVIITCIPLILISTLIYINLTQTIIKEYKNSISENLNKCVQQINSEFTMYVQKSNPIIQNPYLIKSLQNDYAGDIEKMMVFFTNLDIFISEPFGNSNKGYFSLYPFNDSLYEGSYIERFERIKDEKFIQEVVKNKSPNVIWDPQIHTKKYDNSTRYIRFYRNIIDFKTPVGLLEANIPFDRIEYMMENTGLPENGLIYSTDSQGKVIYLKNNASINIENADKINGSDYLSITQELPNGFRIYVAIPWTIIHKKEFNTFMVLFTVLSLIIAVMYFASKFSTKRITARLERFINVIVKDDALLLNEDLIRITGDDEVVIIKQRFKELISRINELHAETTAIKLQKSAFEMELLQSRINPHLLYNSLSVIKWNAQWNKDSKTVELINSMVKYYRAALNKGNNIIKIKDEIEMVREYVRINEFSYSCRYELKIDFDERILNYFTIKHLMQPVVENSILHGLNGMEGGEISITGRMENEDIIIQIKDNGRGIEESKVNQILNMRYDTVYGGYGIKNLIKRIRMYYGEDYGLGLESQIGVGTAAIIRIRALGDNELVARSNTF